MRGVICAILALSGLGCRSVYRFRCTSRPTGAGVLVGEQRLGATACRIKIPKRSELIQDGRIEFTFCLPDGRDAADSSFASDSQARSDRHRLSTALLGLGFLGARAGVYALLGGDAESLSDYPVFVDGILSLNPPAGGCQRWGLWYSGR